MKEPILKDSTPHDEKICGENAKYYITPNDGGGGDGDGSNGTVAAGAGMDIWRPSYSINADNVMKNISVFLIADINQTITHLTDKLIDIHEYQLNEQKSNDDDNNDRMVDNTSHNDDHDENSNDVIKKSYVKVKSMPIVMGNENDGGPQFSEERNPKSLFSSDRIFAIQFFFGQLETKADDQFILQGRFRFLDKGKKVMKNICVLNDLMLK